MPKSKTRGKIVRSRKRSFAESVEFPRWVLAAEVVLIGFMLLLAALSDSSGKVRTPGAGSILYMAAVLGVAALLIYVRRDHPPNR